MQPQTITTTLGIYNLLTKLGEGGVGEVYMGMHAERSTLAALKLLLPQHEREGSKARIRFLNEAKVLHKLSHPHLVKCRDYGSTTKGGRPCTYMLLDYVEGQPLKKAIKLPEYQGTQQILTLFLPILDAVGYLHRNGVVHRDLKPSNMMLRKDGVPILLDLGVAKIGDRAIVGDISITELNMRGLGTLLYMSPEHIKSPKQVDARTDIYSMGVTLYHLLTGQPPYDSSTVSSEYELMDLIVRQPLPRLVGVPNWLQQVLDKATAKAPEARYQSCAEFAAALQGAGRGEDTEKTTMETAPPPFSSGLGEETQVEEAAPDGAGTGGAHRESPPHHPPPLPKAGRGKIGAQGKPEAAQGKPAKKSKPAVKWGLILLGSLVGIILYNVIRNTDANSSGSLNTDTRQEENIGQGEENAAQQQEDLGNSSLPDVTSLESIGKNMVKVEGGTFQMGSNDNRDNEKPVHTVELSSFYMGKTEVTQAQWRKVMGNNPSRFKGCDECPVEGVSWNDIQEFLKILNQMTGQNYRLPTEAEWEYVARGGNKSRGYTYAGSKNPSEVAWNDKNSDGKTHPVAQKKPNELGLYDMSGNVWEWCSDWFNFDYYVISPRQNPQGPSLGASRVNRGGSWDDSPEYSRVANRIGNTPTVRGSYLGFRLAR